MKSNRLFLITFVIYLSFHSFYTFIYFPMIGNPFDYWHMAESIRITNSGFIDSNSMNPSYYILTAIIHNITDISYDIIPTLPLQSIPFILLFILLIRNITQDDLTSPIITIVLALIYLTKFGNVDAVIWWSHGIGFILSLLFLFIAILRLKSDKNHQNFSILLILLLISINYISYKMAFFTLILLIGLQINKWFLHTKIQCKEKQNEKFMSLILIGTIYFFTFNKIIYNEFIPRLRIASEITTSSLDKLFIGYKNNPFDPFDIYRFRTPLELRVLNTIWLTLILIGLILLVLVLFHTFLKKKDFSIGEKLIWSLLFSSFIILIIYSFLGATEISLLIFTSIMGYSLLFKKYKRTKNFIVIILILLLITNVFIIFGIKLLIFGS